MVPGLMVMDESEEISTDPAHHRLDDVEDSRGSDGGVDGVSAFLQHPKAGRGG